MKEFKRPTISQTYLNLTNLNNTRFYNVKNDNLERYLHDADKYNQLPWEKELELIVTYQEKRPGYMQAKTTVISSHQKFVFMAAKRYRPSDVDICDLISEANVGLNIALDRFDASKNTKFITFASRYILKYIFEFLEDNNLIYQPNHTKVHGVIDRITEQFFNKNGYYPSLDELHDEFLAAGIIIKNKLDLVNVTVEPIDILLPANNEDDDEPTREIGLDARIEEDIDTKLLHENLMRALQKLSDTERYVIVKKYGLDGREMTVSGLAWELGVSVVKVNKLLRSAMSKLQAQKSLFI